MRYWRRSVVLVCAGVSAACSARVAPPPVAAPELGPDALYAVVRSREAQVQTLRARFAARVRHGAEVRRADGVLLVKKPDRFRLRLFSTFGLTVFDYTSWDTHDRMELPLEGKRFADAEIADHSPFSPADMRHVFLRTAEPAALRCSAQSAGSETVVDCRDAEGQTGQLMRIGNVTRTVAQEIRFVAGQPELIMQFDDYRRVEAMELPFKIDLLYPEKDVHLEIVVRGYEVNPTLADSLFEPPQDSGAGS